MTKRDIMIKSINRIIRLKKKGLTVYSISLNPKQRNMKEEKLMYYSKCRILNNIFKQKKELVNYFIVVEYGNQVTNLSNQNIKWLGTHSHIVLTTSLSKEKIEQIVRENVDFQHNVKVSELKEIYNPFYWIKGFTTFGNMKIRTNCINNKAARGKLGLI